MDEETPLYEKILRFIMTAFFIGLGVIDFIGHVIKGLFF